jgi:hypothetical protein
MQYLLTNSKSQIIRWLDWQNLSRLQSLFDLVDELMCTKFWLHWYLVSLALRFEAKNQFQFVFYANVVNLQFNKQKQRITIYPNPADEYVMVHIEDATEKAATLRLYNVYDQSMKQMKFDELPNGDIRIALDNLVDGSYYLHLMIDGQHTIVEKLVVDKLNGYRPDVD